MKAGQILDVTLRSMRVVDVKPGSTLLVGSLPNGQPFEVRVPFDADVRTAPVERTGPIDDLPSGPRPLAARRDYICLPCLNGEHQSCDWDEQTPPARCACRCDERGPLDSDTAAQIRGPRADGDAVQCASTLAEYAAHAHRCALYVDAGPHTDCNHLCECGKQWGGA